MIEVGEREPFSSPPVHPFVLRYDDDEDDNDDDGMRENGRHKEQEKEGLDRPRNSERGVEMPASIIPETMTDRHRYRACETQRISRRRAPSTTLHLESIYQGTRGSAHEAAILYQADYSSCKLH